MSKGATYEPVSLEDGDFYDGERRRFYNLTRRERLRLHVGGILFIGVGGYIIWRTILLISSLFSPPATPSSWDGWAGTRYTFIFGDSYTTVGYDVHGEHPSESNPLGNPPYPGYTAAEGPNWVGWLATEYNKSNILVHDFAVGGATVQGVEAQVRDYFLPYAGQKPDWAMWKERDSLFLTWIGINDINRWLDPQAQITLLFQLQENLYEVGARNFVYFKVPPFERSPQQQNNEQTKSRIREWNSRLAEFVSVFRNRHQDASVYIYDVVNLFTEVLDNPKAYGFKDASSMCPTKECIWNDDLHPTSAMHRLIAADLERFLFLNSI